MGRKKVKLPLREGSQLPPLTEEERLRRRTIGHPLDDFPLSPRMSQWREVGSTELAGSAITKRSIKRSDKRSTEPLSNKQNTTVIPEEVDKKYLIQDPLINTNEDHERSIKRSTERIYEPLVEPFEIKQSKESYVALDATHTASESKIYSYLYRLSIVRGQPTCRASLKEIKEALGLSKNTIIKALRGLAEKLSIDVLDRRAGSRIGSQYHIFPVKDIIARRKDAGIEIDDFKQITLKGSIERSFKGSIERSKTEPLNVQKLNVQMNVQTPTKLMTSGDLESPPRNTKNLLLRNDDDLIKSSSIDNNDDEPLTTIRCIYCELTGNDWKDQDEIEVLAIGNVSISHIILGICYSLDRAPGHKVNSIKYVIPAILDHFADMKSFPEKELLEIAYRHMLRVKQAMRKNKWSMCGESTE